MADKEIVLRFRVVENGFEVFDQAGNKIRDVSTAADAATKSFSNTQASIITLSQAMNVARTVWSAVGQAVEAVTGSIKQVDAYGEMARAVGLSVQGLTELRVAAQQGGVSLNELGTAVSFFQRELVNAAGGGGKAKLFDALGISPQELQQVAAGTRSTNTVLIELSSTFEKLSRAQQVAFSRELFGRGGSPILNVLTGQLKEQIATAHDLGAVITNEMEAAANSAANSLDNMTVAVQSLHEQIGIALAPQVEQVAKDTTNWVAANRELITQNVSDWSNSFAQVLRDKILPFLRSTRQEFDLLNEAYKYITSHVVTFGAGPGGVDIGIQGADWGTGVSREQGVLSGGSDITNAVRGVRSALPSRASLVVPPLDTGRGNRDAEKAAEKAERDLEKRTAASLSDEEKVRLALLDAQVSMRERAIKLSEDDLRLAKESGASAQDQLRIAGQLDALEQQRLLAVQTRIQAELDGLLQFGPTINPEVVKLQDQLVGVNEELAKGPQHAADLARALEQSKQVVIDIGQSLNESLQRAVDGILNSNGKFNIGDLLTNTLRAQASTIIGGGIQSLFSGGEFKIEGLDRLTGAFDKVGNWFSRLFGGGGTPSSVSGGGLRPLTIGPDGQFSDVTGGGSSTAPSAGGGGGSAGLGIGLAAASYGASVALDIALNAHERVNALFQGTNTLRRTLTRGEIADAAGGGGIVGGIGRTIVNNFNGLRGGLGGAALASFDPISAILAGSSLFNAPTAGTQRTMGLENIYNKALLPQQRGYSYGGHSGLRAQFLNVAPGSAEAAAFGAAGFGFDLPGLEQPTLDILSTPGRNGATYAKNPLLVQGVRGDIARAQAARPNVESIRTDEALGLGVALTGNARGGVNVANELTNNLLLLGVGAEEARRQLLKVAQTAGVDLIGGLESLNKAYLEHKLSQEQLSSSAAGLVHLFNDTLPKAIDVNKIVADRTNAQGGINIAGVTAGIKGALSAYQIEQQIADVRLQNLDPRLQGTEIKKRISALDTQLQDNTLTYAQRQDILEQRSRLGFQYIQYADQRYAPGSARTREEAYGYAVAQGSADQLKALGEDTSSTADNTTATADNTKALQATATNLKGLKESLDRGLKGKVTLDVTGLNSDDGPVLEQMIRKIVKDVLQSPEVKAAQRETVS